MELVGLVGKANVGKSTLFSALTLLNVQIGNYPFTTKTPNRGITYLTCPCVHSEFGVTCNPNNAPCVDGVRYVPIEVLDCPGIVRGAHKGRGMGLQFLDEVRQADALIVVVDSSGGTDEDGNPVEPGTHDPLDDVRMVEEEFDRWMLDILMRDWNRIARLVENKQSSLEAEVAKRFSGLRIKEGEVLEVLESSDILRKAPSKLSESELLSFATSLRKASKPFIIAANKSDVPGAEKGISSLMGCGYRVVPCSGEVERALRLASEKGLIRYLPGSDGFEVIDESRLTQQQRDALKRVEEFMKRNGGTGVQKLIDIAYREVLDYVPVFPVEDPNRLTDRKGRVLPDVYLVKRGSTPRDLAYKIHTELGEGFLYAIDARNGMRLPSDFALRPGDVISIVSARKR
ncbi:MAG: redox-regulated ATPase YchF [Aigarchaeota archaeon]|nr:redox-regulated ATPase YchF [Aigarchaeota archaeon]